MSRYKRDDTEFRQRIDDMMRSAEGLGEHAGRTQCNVWRTILYILVQFSPLLVAAAMLILFYICGK